MTEAVPLASSLISQSVFPSPNAVPSAISEPSLKPDNLIPPPAATGVAKMVTTNKTDKTEKIFFFMLLLILPLTLS
jgi:hypothetical protein